MFTNLAPCVSDFLLWSGGLLLAVLVIGLFVRQPARRIAIWWAAVVGISALAVLAISPRWSTVHLRSEFVPPAMNELEQTRGATGVPPVEVENQRPSQDIHWRHDSGVLPMAKPIDWPKLLISVYLGGAAVTGGWLGLGYIAARRLVRGAKSASVRVTRLAGQLGLKRPPQLLESDRLASAVALGLWRPTVVLPREFCECVSDEELRSVLAHELAHVRHGDLWLLAALVTLAPLLWCQPLFWLLRRRVRLDQETLADAAAADHTTRPDYAANLLAWARTASPVRPAPLTAPLTATVGLWESPAQLKARIATLLDERLVLLRHTTRRWRLVSMVAIATLAGGLSLVTWAPAGEVTEGEAKKPSPVHSYSIPLPPSEPNVVRGLCVDERHQPVKDAEVALYVYKGFVPGQQKLKPAAKTTTGANGEFRFDPAITIKQEFPAGSPWDTTSEKQIIHYVAITAYKPGLAKFVEYLQIAPELVKSGHADIIWMKNARTLRGQVVDESGRPVLGALVNAGDRVGNTSDLPSGILCTAITDADGRFAINDLEPYEEKSARASHESAVKSRREQGVSNVYGSDEMMPRQIEIIHPDYAHNRTTVLQIPGEVNVMLRSPGTFKGRVVLRATDQVKPAKGVLVTLFPQGRDLKMMRSLSTRVDENGDYQFSSLPSGKFFVDVRAPDQTWVSKGSGSLAVRAGETVTAPDIEFNRGGTVRIQLIDAKSKQPLTSTQGFRGYLTFESPIRARENRGWLPDNPSPSQAPKSQVGHSMQFTTFSKSGIVEHHRLPGKVKLVEVVAMQPDGSSRYTSKNEQATTAAPELTLKDGETEEVNIEMFPARP